MTTENFKSNVREWLIKEKLGLLSFEDLIKLLDTQVENISNPPDWLLSLSIGEIPIFDKEFDLVAFPITASDVKPIVRDIFEKFSSSEMTIDELNTLACMILARIETEHEIYDLFIWINDQIDLCKIGILNQIDVTQEIKEAFIDFLK